MKKLAGHMCMVLLLLSLTCVSSALAMDMDYAGDWVCMYVDMGDGEMLTEYQGVSLQENISIKLLDDGTVLLTSFGMQEEGTWQPTGAGISMFADDTLVPFTYTDEQLVNTEDGITMYFVRAESITQQGGFSTLMNLGNSDAQTDIQYAGTWKALSYEASGISYDIAMFFPEGVTVTLQDDGTGFVQLTPEYAEPFAWSEADGILAIDGSNFLYDPVWDPETETLSLCYTTDIIRITFTREDTAAAQQPDTADTLTKTYACDYFTAAFPESWEEDEYNIYSWDNYFSAQYDLNDEDGWALSSVRIIASMEEVANYRNMLDTLLGYAKENGKDTLDEISIGGLTFLGTEYGDYWTYAEYLARVPEASITLSIEVSSPEEIADVLPAILASIDFTFPIPDPPLSDPPLPEDGVPYQPAPASVTVGDYDLQAVWLSADAPIVTRDPYDASIAVIDDTVYVLTGQTLRVYTRDGDMLSTLEPVTLNDEYSLLSASWDGTLFITDGYYQAMTLMDGTAQEFELDGYLTMHPQGEWGLCYWASSDVKRIAFTEDGMATKSWILTDLDDDEARQGRFSSSSIHYDNG